MTNLINKAAEIASVIRSIKGVVEVKVWTKVAGKESIYVTLMRADKRGNNFGGEGANVRVDLNTGLLMASNSGYNDTPFFNSYTMSFHQENDTLAKIKAAIN